MAKTTEFKTHIEPFVQKKLGKWFSGHVFEEKALQVGKRKDGTNAYHKFDAVSEDGTIIASIKSHSWKTSGDKRPAGKIGAIYQSLYFLSLVKADTKLLILTDEETYKGFLKDSDGKVTKDIRIKFCRLSPQLEKLAVNLHKRARQEIDGVKHSAKKKDNNREKH